MPASLSEINNLFNINNWGGRTQISRSQNGVNISRNVNFCKLPIHTKAHNIIINIIMSVLDCNIYFK